MIFVLRKCAEKTERKQFEWNGIEMELEKYSPVIIENSIIFKLVRGNINNLLRRHF